MVFVVILLLILLNSYFSLAEIALIAVKKGQLETLEAKGNTAAIKALSLIKDPESFLSAVQVGITLLSLVEGIYGGDLVATRLQPVLQNMGLPAGWSHILSLVIGIGLITYFTIVIGELLPKSIALQEPLKVSLAIAPSLVIFSKIAYPFIKALTWSTRVLLNLLHIKTQGQEQISEQDLLQMLSAAQKQGVLEQKELWLHQNIFAFGDLTAGRMMKPLSLARCVDEAWDDAAVEALIRQYPYTHFPVFKNTPANTVSVLNVKSFLLDQAGRWQDRTQPLCRVPESMEAAEVFARFKEANSDFAVVIDAQEKTTGIITMQDIMEGVFGDIPELETYREFFFKLDAKQWQAHGYIHLQRIRRTLDLLWMRDFEASYLSLNELLTGELGHSPIIGDNITLHEVHFKVEEVKDSIATRVIIQLPS